MEPTFDEAIEELRIAIGRLLHDLTWDMLKGVFLPVRLFLWLNGE